ncbi:lymphocyte antigen 6G6e-like [Hemicordylus capensis]|uniref:lymphocyte antigen 6G6e-like n=1 Tax=Hemicordylus capensis TaxID=884348 RepID=UPI0023044306|nr:lymphocyte antigen 6G6e-like [Hemicordylus capensis]XP_053145858.1 lymphocyte antigen 6G6e-like [Hemicordylus capensis]XP_053145859.1 lymphocyte antigen 6G6e-like [Hemicordylus capensis]XP_053145860.1 lymphocyte antigen 6G6e-like [Hemicordylus capensis]XP_053145861.1 lymphocyte antigen 6G6e-like [Hemicordylus capensis]XP_053145862.1 lymphocyte antigen 6G6e-like [Hemicordylus capensis]XP_053145863.1 lymphocyte antigen 6G6e-like [Hemicordylus capensis]XP_053145864.1 lymphocyte antigen 6G6e-
MTHTAVTTLLLTVSFFPMALCQDAGKQGLRCYRCGFDQPCVETLVNCSEGERCGTISGHSDYKVHESILRKDCVPAQKCDSNDKLTYWNNPFRVTYSCCNTDFCNRAISGAPRPSATHLPMLLVATILAILLTFLS